MSVGGRERRSAAEQPRDFKVRSGVRAPVGPVSASDSFGRFHDERSSDKRMRRQFAYSSVTITPASPASSHRSLTMPSGETD